LKFEFSLDNDQIFGKILTQLGNGSGAYSRKDLIEERLVLLLSLKLEN